MLMDRRMLLTSAVLLASAPASAGPAIDESLFVSAGGLEQWINITGTDAGNPVLLVVHGGPGEAQWPVAEKYAPWRDAFTVVLWDQRGAGHTYGRYGAKTPDMNLEQFARDGIDVTNHLCRMLGKRKIILLGHSWGSIVGVRMAQLKPELFAAYVGTGQVESWSASVNGQFDLLLAKARRDNDQDAIKTLTAIGRPDPANAKQYFGFTKNLQSVMAPSDRDWIASLRGKIPAWEKADPKNFQDFHDGFDFSAEAVLPDQMKTDLPATAGKLDTAFFVIQGADDAITPTGAATDYFNKMQAPEKRLVLIPNAGHFAFMTAPSPFLDALTQTVRPAAIRRGA